MSILDFYFTTILKNNIYLAKEEHEINPTRDKSKTGTISDNREIKYSNR